jgi:adenylosuccinate lyase
MIERYSRPEMRELWSDRARYQAWLEVELAACRAMETLGDVPAGTAEHLRQKIHLVPERILEIEERTRHDVIAFLTHLEEQAGEPVRWLHLGMTSSDVLDTAFALQLRQAGQMLLEDLTRLMEVLEGRARELKDVAMVGRTHGMHAEPTSLGLVFVGTFAEMRRHRARLTRAVRSISTGKIAGAVGVYGNVSPEVERIALAALGLAPETCATQIVQRDRHAELFTVLAGIASSVERTAIQVRHWQRTEVGEASEPFGRGQKGSSAMPHKRNPILAENLCGLARLVRSYALAALENVALWHERDISHSSAERVIAPDATILLDFMLHRLSGIMEGLVIDRERIANNLGRSAGLIFSEAVMLALVRKGLPRQRAYELVQRSALAALDGNGEFAALLQGDPEVSRHLGPEEIGACFDLRHHLRYVDLIFARVFEENPEEGAP